MNNKFGGNVYQEDINRIMEYNSKKYNMRYSHSKENRWNLWENGSGLTLTFALNRGLFSPALVGIKRETLEKFYSTCPADVDGWVRHYISYYYKELKTLYSSPELQRQPKEIEQAKKLVLKRNKTKKKAKEKEQGYEQLSLFDMDGLKW